MDYPNEYNFQRYEEVMDLKDGIVNMNQSVSYKFRVLAWMFYLNDAKCGTEF